MNVPDVKYQKHIMHVCQEGPPQKVKPCLLYFKASSDGRGIDRRNKRQKRTRL